MIFLVNELLTTDILYSIIHISMTERVYYKQPLWFVLLQSEKKSTTSRPQEAERTTLSILFGTDNGPQDIKLYNKLIYYILWRE